MSMTDMTDIQCQRGHDTHAHLNVRVNLAEPHGYNDLAPVPDDLVVPPFPFRVWSPVKYPIDGGPYCPAHDAVSHTIADCGIWEPSETICTLAALRAKPGRVLDMGAHVGWFTVLALLCGCTVEAYEADLENVRLLEVNVDAIGLADHCNVHEERVGPRSRSLAPWNIRLAKLDLEGAEPDAIRMLGASLSQGRVDHLCVEVTPAWVPQMGHLVPWLMEAGYDAYLMPLKHVPPAPLAIFPDDLEHRRLEPMGLRAEIDTWHQETVWFHRRGTPW